MYLKQLDIQGFKSFPERTRLEFNKGITAVVGPNGSGKSNISDAVRWVLGEQSAKNLRGGKMEDVIFAGTGRRRPLGAAEVSITIDNADNKLPVAFEEITVTRRVYRSGEGEYLLNGVSVRLKDIHEIFMDTGLGREGYSIIGQGRIDEILNTRSEDRRLLFEEAAGIIKYKNRKQEAQRKLAVLKQDLTRVNDITAEVLSQLEPLQTQSETAAVYIGLTERLKLVKVNIFLTESERTAAKIKQFDESLAALAGRIEHETTLKDGAKQQSAADTHALKQLEADTGSLKDEAASLLREAERLENEAKLAQQRVSFLSEDIARLKGELDGKAKLLVAGKGRKEELEAELYEISLKLNENELKLAEAVRAMESFSGQTSEAEESSGLINLSVARKTEEIAVCQGELNRLAGVYGELEKRKEQLNDEMLELSDRLALREAEGDTIQSKTDSLNAELARLSEQISFYESENQTLTQSEKTDNERYISATKLTGDASARYKLLKDLSDSREGYYRSVKAVLSRKLEDVLFKGIRGTVGDLITAGAGYETAIEIALGAAVQNIVTETEDDVYHAIEYLKKIRGGRATFMPLNAMRPSNTLSPKSSLMSEAGVIGPAFTLVGYESEYEKIVLFLLGRVIVIDTLENALNFNKKHGYSHKIVTPSGELLNPGGTITGGRDNTNASGFFSRKAELMELEGALPKYEREENELSRRLRETRSRLIKNKDALSQLYSKVKQKDTETRALSQELLKVREQIRSISERLDTQNREDTSLMDRLEETNSGLRAERRRLSELTGELNTLKNELDNLSRLAVTGRELKESKASEIADLKMAINELMQRLKACQEKLAQSTGEISGATREADRVKTEISEKEDSLREAEALIETRQEEAAVIRRHISAKQSLVDELSLNREELTKKIEDAEREASDKEALLSRYEGERIRLEMKKEQADADLRRLYDALWDDYSLTYQTAREYEHIDLSASQLASEERELKSRIRDMGDVNIGAIEEYKQVQARYDYLSRQKGDIEKSLEDLSSLVETLEADMAGRFKEQLALISDNFDYVFREMFGGGQAQLVLSDENNILGSGVDIKAQPPGKNLQLLSLMSGGEKALTAMALLFGILRMKPSPFCVLDEIEAALDEANVNRFTNYLKHFSFDTQFILITHKKGTMAAADSLYGVTMQEQGVSRLVSVKFS